MVDTTAGLTSRKRPWTPGDACEYYSPTHQRWLRCRIKEVEGGDARIDIKPEWLTPDVVEARLRPPTDDDSDSALARLRETMTASRLFCHQAGEACRRAREVIDGHGTAHALRQWWRETMTRCSYEADTQEAMADLAAHGREVTKSILALTSFDRPGSTPTQAGPPEPGAAQVTSPRAEPEPVVAQSHPEAGEHELPSAGCAPSTAGPTATDVEHVTSRQVEPEPVVAPPLSLAATGAGERAQDPIEQWAQLPEEEPPQGP